MVARGFTERRVVCETASNRAEVAVAVGFKEAEVIEYLEWNGGKLRLRGPDDHDIVPPPFERDRLKNVCGSSRKPF
jgi:hypothetical protein